MSIEQTPSPDTSAGQPPLSDQPAPPLTPVTRILNVRPWGREPSDIIIKDGKIAEVVPTQHNPGTTRAQGVIDGRGLLALPGLVNAHAHVDKSWLGLPWQSYGGEPTTQGRIAHERAHRHDLGIPSAQLTGRVLWQMVKHGTTAIRTHVDVDLGIELDGILAVEEATDVYKGALDVQVVAFPQDGILRRPGVDKLLEAASIRPNVFWIGGLDPAGIDRDPVGQIDLITRIAADSSLGVDIHLHDPGELGAFQIELLCDYAHKRGLQGRINIAHGFALAQVSDAYRAELLARLGDLGVTFTTVAPLRLPQLPLGELATAGVKMGFGTDGIRDLWSPYGTGDTLGIAWQYGRATSSNTDEALMRIVTTATDPWPVRRNNDGLAPGAQADVVLLNAENPMDALVRTPPRDTVIGAGRLLYQR